MDREQPAFEAFRHRLCAGERAPKATLEDLNTGEPVALQSLWRNFALIEFGSFT